MARYSWPLQLLLLISVTHGLMRLGRRRLHVGNARFSLHFNKIYEMGSPQNHQRGPLSLLSTNGNFNDADEYGERMGTSGYEIFGYEDNIDEDSRQVFIDHLKTQLRTAIFTANISGISIFLPTITPSGEPLDAYEVGLSGNTRYHLLCEVHGTVDENENLPSSNPNVKNNNERQSENYAKTFRDKKVPTSVASEKMYEDTGVDAYNWDVAENDPETDIDSESDTFESGDYEEVYNRNIYRLPWANFHLPIEFNGKEFGVMSVLMERQWTIRGKRLPDSIKRILESTARSLGSAFELETRKVQMQTAYYSLADDYTNACDRIKSAVFTARTLAKMMQKRIPKEDGVSAETISNILIQTDEISHSLSMASTFLPNQDHTYTFSAIPFSPSFVTPVSTSATYASIAQPEIKAQDEKSKKREFNVQQSVSVKGGGMEVQKLYVSQEIDDSGDEGEEEVQYNPSKVSKEFNGKRLIDVESVNRPDDTKSNNFYDQNLTSEEGVSHDDWTAVLSSVEMQPGGGTSSVPLTGQGSNWAAGKSTDRNSPIQQKANVGSGGQQSSAFFKGATTSAQGAGSLWESSVKSSSNVDQNNIKNDTDAVSSSTAANDMSRLDERDPSLLLVSEVVETSSVVSSISTPPLSSSTTQLSAMTTSVKQKFVPAEFWSPHKEEVTIEYSDEDVVRRQSKTLKQRFDSLDMGNCNEGGMEVEVEVDASSNGKKSLSSSTNSLRAMERKKKHVGETEIGREKKREEERERAKERENERERDREKASLRKAYGRETKTKWGQFYF